MAVVVVNILMLWFGTTLTLLILVESDIKSRSSVAVSSANASLDGANTVRLPLKVIKYRCNAVSWRRSKKELKDEVSYFQFNFTFCWYISCRIMSLGKPLNSICDCNILKNHNVPFNSSPLDKMTAILAHDIFKCIFMNEKSCILIRISLKFVPTGPIETKAAFVQEMAWRRTGGKPLPELMLPQLADAYMRHLGEMPTKLPNKAS